MLNGVVNRVVVVVVGMVFVHAGWASFKPKFGTGVFIGKRRALAGGVVGTRFQAGEF